MMISNPLPKKKSNKSIETRNERKKRLEDDFLCKGHIWNALSNSLYDVYQNVPSAKELQNKYNAEDVSAQKLLIDVHFRMAYGKSILSQVDELQLYMNDQMFESVKLMRNFKLE